MGNVETLSLLSVRSPCFLYVIFLIICSDMLLLENSLHEIIYVVAA